MSDQECVSDLSQENNLLKTENDKYVWAFFLLTVCQVNLETIFKE